MTRLLIVDDDTDMLEILHLNLVDSGYDVVMAYTGQEAIRKASEECPDLVLLDVKLPDIMSCQRGVT